jgi:hypothetical protein
LKAVLGNRFIKVLWNELVEKNAAATVNNNSNTKNVTTNNTNSQPKKFVNSNDRTETVEPAQLEDGGDLTEAQPNQDEVKVCSQRV